LSRSPSLAIVSALPQEQRTLLERLRAGGEVRSSTIGAQPVHEGSLEGQPVLLALSGVGKVASASTVAALIERHAPRALVFTGVAGGLGEGVRIGDVVVADALLQHDLDASPLFARYEVPFTGRSRFATDPAMSAMLEDASSMPGSARVHRGLVVSGDRFVATAAESAALRRDLPDALAVEMEGAAVAQVCAAFGCPCAVLRVVSDRADDDATVDFMRFVEDVAVSIGVQAVTGMLRAMHGRGVAARS
jgi:adenosylhomocysteine nucleosidase